MAEQTALLEPKTKTKAKAEEPSIPESTVVIWRSIMRSLHMPISVDGKRSVYVRFNQHRLDLDLKDKDDRAIHERLLNSKAYGAGHIDLIVDQGVRQDMVDKAHRFKSLMSKSEVELRRLITAQELRDLGLPVNCEDKATLIMALQELGKLEKGVFPAL